MFPEYQPQCEQSKEASKNDENMCDGKMVKNIFIVFESNHNEDNPFTINISLSSILCNVLNLALHTQFTLRIEIVLIILSAS